MATVNFLYRSTREEAPLTLRLLFRIKGKDYVLSAKTQLIVSASYWRDHHHSKTRDVEIRNRQIEISEALCELEGYVLCEVTKVGLLDMDVASLRGIVHRYYFPADSRSESLLEAIKKSIDRAGLKENNTGGIGLSKNRIKAYGQLYRVIREFQGNNRPYKIKDVDLGFAAEFKDFLINKQNYSLVTVSKFLSDTKTICYQAEREGLEVSPQLRFIKSRTVRSEYVIYLTQAELIQIEQTKLNKPHLENAQKWLLLGCNIGQRVSDLLSLNQDNFTTRGELEVIELKQQKTGKQVTIPVLPNTKRILSSGLPYKISSQKFNSHIKKICKIAKINTPVEGLKMNPKSKRKIKGIYPKWELIASHVCRRSFATNLYGKLPTPLIMSITGHRTERMFLTYIGKSSVDYAQQIADYFNSEELQNNHLEVGQ